MDGIPWCDRPSGRRLLGYANPRRARAAVYRRRRIAIAIVATIGIGLFLVLALALVAPLRSDAVSSGGTSHTVVVEEGDTVWSLALPYTPSGEDPVAYVAEVVARNDLEAKALQPGAILRLPGR